MDSSSRRFENPLEFTTQSYVEPLDIWSHANIFGSLSQAMSMVSEGNIWCYRLATFVDHGAPCYVHQLRHSIATLER
jgi:hypothetical protein